MSPLVICRIFFASLDFSMTFKHQSSCGHTGTVIRELGEEEGASHSRAALGNGTHLLLVSGDGQKRFGP